MINPDGSNSQPTPAERERLLGYPPDATAFPGATDKQRHALTGRSMDQRCLSALFAAMAALADHRGLLAAHHHKARGEA